MHVGNLSQGGLGGWLAMLHLPDTSPEPPAEMSVFFLQDPRSWTVEDISIWLQWLGIGPNPRPYW